jgi:anaerobic magnesium-protoporphyrin IX monomethyl ester cyclase
MRVAVVYPPVTKGGQYPLLSQNRHLKFSHSLEVRIFPLIPAHAATNLQHAGHTVLWLDGINERMTMDDFHAQLTAFQPDLVMLESKAPVIRTHWDYIRAAKQLFPLARFALVGDHVSYYPQESMDASPADFVLTGGDYDVIVRDLAAHLEGRGPMPAGVWWREGGEVKNSGHHVLSDDLDALPYIDRELTRWRSYGEAYLLPGIAYMLTGRGCGLENGRTSTCTFCIWQHALWDKTARLRSPANVVGEIEQLVQLGATEVFDDNETGPIYDRAWMQEFHRLMKEKGLIGRIALSTNARGDLIDAELARLMAATGFRLLKIGIEAGDDESLRQLAKLEGIEKIKAGIRAARDNGLVTLLTTMVGYPWQDEAGVKRTYDVAKEMLLYRPKFGDCLQASVVVPYPGSPLWTAAVNKGWFLIDPKDYDKYDMSEPLMKSQYDNEAWVKRLWKLHLHPWFLLRSLFTLRTRDQWNLAWRGVLSLAGHISDYKPAAGQAGLTQDKVRNWRGRLSPAPADKKPMAVTKA